MTQWNVTESSGSYTNAISAGPAPEFARSNGEPRLVEYAPDNYVAPAPRRPRREVFTESAFINELQNITSDQKIQGTDVTRLRRKFQKPETPVELGPHARALLDLVLSRVEFVGARTRERFADFLETYTGLRS